MGLAIFNRKMGMKLEVLAEGKLIADGTEQNVVTCSELAIISGYISMGNLEAGDTIIVRQYVMVNGTEELYAQETYSSVQPEPLLHVSRRVHKDLVRITVQQTVGSYKMFNYEFVREVN